MERGQIPVGQGGLGMHLEIEPTLPAGPAKDPAGELAARVGARALRLYESRRMLCAEAVLTALNREFGAGLSEAQALAAAAPFSLALGGSGCLCGALSGAVLGVGLVLNGKGGNRSGRKMRGEARCLHDGFKAAFGATCCRILTRRVKSDKKAHFRQCALITARAAEMAAHQILRKRPELIARGTGRPFPGRRHTSKSILMRLLGLFS